MSYLTKTIMSVVAVALLSGCSVSKYTPKVNKDEPKESVKVEPKSEVELKEEIKQEIKGEAKPLEVEKATEVIEKSVEKPIEKPKVESKKLDPFKNMDNSIKPYYVNGRWYYPAKVDIGESFVGVASWYGPDFHGKTTSSGDAYDMHDFTSAHRTLPFDTMLKVTNLQTNRSTVVRVNDRGPFVDDRIIDLSFAAAKDIGIVSSGVAKVKLEVVGFNKEVNFDETKKEIISPTTPKIEIETKDITSEFISVEPVAEIETIEPVRVGTKNHVSHIEKVRAKEKQPIKNFAVQIGAFQKASGAYSTRDKFDNIDGYSSAVKEFNINGMNIYKVWIVGFESYQDAKEFITKNSFNDAFIIVGNR